MSARTKQVPKSKKLLLISVLVLIIFAGIAAVRLYLDFQMRVWNYHGNLIVLHSDTLTVSLYGVDDGTKKDVILPKDAYVIVPGGYGQYQLKHVLALSNSENKEEQLLLDAVSNILGIPIDATDNSLTVWDRLLLNRIEEQDVATQVLNLSEFPIYTSETRPDGNVVQVIDPIRVDFYLKDIFWERGIKEENLAVGVFNAGSEVGIATRTMRILEHIGVRVVDVSNWEEKLTVCELRIRPSLKQSTTYLRIQQYFHCSVREDVTSDRFDMQVIVVN